MQAALHRLEDAQVRVEHEPELRLVRGHDDVERLGARRRGIRRTYEVDEHELRYVLEGAGFAAMHTTDFYSAPLDRLTPHACAPAGHRIARRLPIAAYRELFKSSEDAWAGRLTWTPEQFDGHFARDDVRLVALLRGDQPVGFAELEFCPEDARADVTYLAVHPAERAQGYGLKLLALAAAEAETHPEIRTLRVRAHDHMKPARALYARAGFTHCRSIVTYMRDGDEDV